MRKIGAAFLLGMAVAVPWSGGGTNLALATAPPAAHIEAGPARGQSQYSYFNFASVAPGQDLQGVVTLRNTGGASAQVGLHRALGITAPNSGDAFAVSHPCTGAACWLDPLPATVSLAPGSLQNIPFEVRVPAATPDGQYLIGIEVVPPAGGSFPTGPAVPTGSHQSRFFIRVRQNIVIGIAITVGHAFAPGLVIRGASIGKTLPDSVPTVALRLDNTGNMWLHPAGTLRVIGGGLDRTVPVVSNTILPQSDATLQVPESAIQPGVPYHLHVVLNYYHGTKQAVWDGTAVLNSPTQIIGRRFAKGRETVYVVPTYMLIALYTLGGLVLLLIVLLLFLLRKKRSAAR